MKIIISEKQFEKISKSPAEPKEGIFTPIKGVYQGLKGVWRGEGYDYFKHLSELGELTKDLKRFDEPNRKIMVRLDNLKNKISNAKMPQTKKDTLLQHIDQAVTHFNAYDRYVDAINRAVKTKLD